MVFVATRIESTSVSPTQQRPTARTILLTSTGSEEPLRFFTRMVVWVYPSSPASNAAAGMRAAAAGRDGTRMDSLGI